jgi:hypothetical protein
VATSVGDELDLSPGVEAGDDGAGGGDTRHQPRSNGSTASNGSPAASSEQVPA